MRRIILLILGIAFVSFPNLGSAFAVPEKSVNFVNDYAKVLSDSQKKELENKISDFERKSTNEIAVVVLPSLDGDTIENVAQDIFTKWGIGKKEKNNGVLFLVAMAEHKARIHTGYGVEGYLTDLETSYIQNEITIPHFRNNEYYSGIDKTIDKIIESFNGEDFVPENYLPEKSSGLKGEFIFVILFFVFQWLVAILGRSKSWWGGGILGGIAGGVVWFLGWFSPIISIILFVFLILFGLGFDYVVSKAYQKAKGKGSRFPWWIGGGFGGHNGSGGGFGGGFSGGGGSSSSW